MVAKTEEKKNVLAKLAELRERLSEMDIRKSGENTFARYRYFELEDFLPLVNHLSNKIGLCGVFNVINGIARLDIYDTFITDSNWASISFEIPFSEAQLKGCHPVQNLGAAVSYSRRYLWMIALELSESDALDATTGEIKPEKKPTAPAPVKSEQSAPATADVDSWKAALEQCTGVADLAAVWQTMPKELHTVLADVKNEMKQKILGE